MTSKKPMTGADRTRASTKKYKAAGLIQAKVWAHPDEAPGVRAYAAEQPLTKAILDELKR